VASPWRCISTWAIVTLAWDTERWTHDTIREYLELWAAREFGAEFAVEAAGILAGYTRFNGRRKPELLRPDTYSLVDYQEFEGVVAEYEALAAQAEALYLRLPAHKRSGFYQLVLFNTVASAQLNALYLAAGRNALYAEQGRAATNAMAALTRELFAADQALMAFFNEALEGGKWMHFMDQPKIGYVSWRDPPEDSLQAITLTELELPAAAALGVAVDGDRRAWPLNVAGESSPAGAPGRSPPAAPQRSPPAAPYLPLFDAFNRQQHGIEVFNRGREPFEFAAEASEPWVRFVDEQGRAVATIGGFVTDQLRLPVTIDWDRVPRGDAEAVITIAGAGTAVDVRVQSFAPTAIDRNSLDGFVESDGIVAIEAEHFTAATEAGGSRWLKLEDYGHTLSGMRADGPVDVAGLTPGIDSPSLQYRMYRFSSGPAEVSLTVAPTLNFAPDRGLRVAVAFDDEPARLLTLVPQGYDAANGNRDWEESVRNNYRIVTSSHELDEPGYHTLRIWMVDPAVVVQRIVVADADAEVPRTYLGPPESFRN
jgi:hypothetical protein